MDSKTGPVFSVGDIVEIINGVLYVGRRGEVKEVLDSFTGREHYVFVVLLNSKTDFTIGRYASGLRLIESTGCKTDVSTVELMEILENA